MLSLRHWPLIVLIALLALTFTLPPSASAETPSLPLRVASRWGTITDRSFWWNTTWVRALGYPGGGYYHQVANCILVIRWDSGSRTTINRGNSAAICFKHVGNRVYRNFWGSIN